MAELGELTLVPESYKLMLNRQFQEWLVLVSILQRDPNRNAPSIKPSEVLKQRDKQVLDLLLEEKDNIVSPYEFYEQVFPRSAGIQDEGRYRKRALSQAGSAIYDLRARLQNPECIITAYGFGYGIGIEELHLSGQEGRLLYRLWQDLGKVVSTEDLLEGLFGVRERKLKPANRLAGSLHRLKDVYLKGNSGVEIRSQNDGSGHHSRKSGYQLVMIGGNNDNTRN